MDEEMFNPAWKEKSTTHKRRLIVIAVFTSIGFIAALVVNILLVFERREVENISAEQIALIAAMLDTLHEEVAAARAPRHGALALYLCSIILPLAAGVWLLFQAQRAAVSHEHVIRVLIRSGSGESLVRAYLNRSREALSLPATDGETDRQVLHPDDTDPWWDDVGE